MGKKKTAQRGGEPQSAPDRGESEDTMVPSEEEDGSKQMEEEEPAATQRPPADS